MSTIEWDFEAQEKMPIPLGKREVYPHVGIYWAEVLKEHGVSVAFGIYGGHIYRFVDGMSRIGIKTITTCHENNAGYMAEAYSQVTQKPSVVFVTAGPGVGNVVSAVQQASLSNSPMIIITAGPEHEHEKLGTTIQESYAAELLQSLTKWSQRFFIPSVMKQFTTRAFKTAQAAPKGPVLLEYCMSDVMTSIPPGRYGEHASWIPQWRFEDTAKPLESGGNPEYIAKAVECLFAAEKPFLVIGDGSCWAQASKELEELINLAKIPFNGRRLGRGLVSERHPYHIRRLPPFKKEIDLMISSGVKVGFFEGYGADWPETIQIAEAEQHIWTFLPTKVAILGNPRVVARQMIDYIKSHNLTPPPERDEWIQRVQEAAVITKERLQQKALRYKDHPRYQKKDCIHWGYLAKVITDYVEERYDSRNRMIIDGYTMSDFIVPFITAVRPAQVLTSSESAGLGHGVGMAIGAAIADIETNGDRTPVVSLMGDSGMGVAGTEIETAVKLKLPIVFIVTNNNGWLTGLKYTYYGSKWESYGEQDQLGNEWQGMPSFGNEKLPDVRWDEMCKTMGAYGETVDRHENIVEALERCFTSADQGIPAVLNCIMDSTITNRGQYKKGAALCTGHIPFEELPEKGKTLRRYWFSKEPRFSALNDGTETKLPDNWEPVDDEG